MKIAHAALIVLLVSPLGIASARPQQDTSSPSDQQPTDSLAAAARRTRDQKKDQPKPAKVWDNDNIPTKGTSISVVGSTPAPAEASATPDAASPNPPAAGTAPSDASAAAPDKSAIQADLLAAKDQIESLKTDLDILQRKYTLDQQTYYGKTNYAADKAGAAALQDEKDQIDSKQQAIVDAQKKMDDLQTQLNATKSDPSAPAK
jgi:hypothetical protein